MSIEHDIQRLFRRILDEENGNKAAAANRLNTNAVTFWGWITGSRGQKGRQTFYNAIDLAGGRLLVPGDMESVMNGADLAVITQERDELLKKCQEQEKRIGELEAEIRGMKTAMEYMRPQPDSLSTAAEGRKAG